MPVLALSTCDKSHDYEPTYKLNLDAILVGVYSNIKAPTKLAFGFLGDYVSGELTTSTESLETEWVARHSALPRISHPAIYDRMKDMLDFSGRVIYRVYTNDPYQVCEECFL